VSNARERTRRQPLWRILLRISLRQFLFAVPFALFFGTLYGGTWDHYWSAYLISVVFSFTIGLALMALDRWILPHLERPNATGGRSVPMPTEIASYTITSVLASYLAAAIVRFTFLPQILDNPRAFVIFGMYSLLFSMTIGGIAYAMHFYRVSIERAGAIERVRAELAQAELRALRAQLHPHFLFNTLNSIASLIPTHPKAAEEMTTRLADVFRYALRASERDRAPLSQELEFLRAYLDIEKARFGDRLRIEESIAPGVESAAVPTLLLQPLVENAVRHGIAPRPQGGTIRLAARADGDRLVLAVEDDGLGFDAAGAAASPHPPRDADDAGGFGLHAVRERLRAEGLADAMTIESAPGRGTRVVLTLPLQPGELR
jgi:anti-sigma regulatory factor (Ser/Thr protein kinase)